MKRRPNQLSRPVRAHVSRQLGSWLTWDVRQRRHDARLNSHLPPVGNSLRRCAARKISDQRTPFCGDHTRGASREHAHRKQSHRCQLITPTQQCCRWSKESKALPILQPSRCRLLLHAVLHEIPAKRGFWCPKLSRLKKPKERFSLWKSLFRSRFVSLWPLLSNVVKLLIWCPGWGSNPQDFRRQILSLLRLPIPPPGRREAVKLGARFRL